MKTTPAAEYAVLGALMSGPKHGYEIIQFLENALGFSWYVGTSQLYSVLKRLERDGLVRSTVETQHNRPSKRMFTLTKEGREALKSWLKTPSEHVRDMRVEFLAKLFFLRNLSRKEGPELIEAQIRVLEKSKERISKKKRQEEDLYFKLVYEFKLATVDAWLKWLVRQAKPFMEKSLAAGRSNDDQDI